MKCPLTGKFCNVPRTLHITDIKNGVVEETHLCQICAVNVDTSTGEIIPPKKQDISIASTPNPSHPNLGNALGEFLDFLAASMQAKDKLLQNNRTPCPNCGITLQEIAETKRLGCPVCYDHFEKELHSVLRAVQGGSIQHVGKVPKKWAKENQERLEQKEREADIHERIRLLKSKQANAIKLENYEAAGVLKTKIEELEKKLNASSESTPPSSEDQ